MATLRDFSFVVIGGGILGTYAAALASAAGCPPLVLRLQDDGCPRADTLRNQGWLQSGIMYRIKELGDEEKYKAFAAQTYLAGLQLLRDCGLPAPAERGLLRVTRDDRIDELERKAALLKLSATEFHRLGKDEARARLGPSMDEDATYFAIPDAPFDEAGILSHLRKQAQADGATFWDVSQPVTVSRSGGGLLLKVDGHCIETPLVVIAAGAGSFRLMKQAGHALDGELRRTPLLVADAPPDMAAPIYVDLDLGFSAVRHSRVSRPPAVVIGTRARRQPAPFRSPDLRRIPAKERQELSASCPPSFGTCLSSGRYTAGYEVIPGKSTKLSAYEPWLEKAPGIIFASPGRATVAGLAASKVLAAILAKLTKERRRTTAIDVADVRAWDASIAMHYMPSYAFNDGKR